MHGEVRRRRRRLRRRRRRLRRRVAVALLTQFRGAGARQLPPPTPIRRLQGPPAAHPTADRRRALLMRSSQAQEAHKWTPVDVC